MTLEQLTPGAVKVLLTLYRKDKDMYVRELQREAGVGGGIHRALLVLVRFGLVTVEKRYRMKFVSLTEDGRRLAELLDKADILLEEISKKRGHSGSGSASSSASSS